MSKMAHSNDATMEAIERMARKEDGTMSDLKNNATALREPDGAHGARTLELTGGRTIAKIEAALVAKLDPNNVKEREQGGSKVKYIEGWHAIQTMNEIFGHLNWSRETVVMREVCRYENKNSNHVVGYEAKVVVTVHLPGAGKVIREGTGHGSGIAKDLFSAIESAGKEAETDAMKRALMTFGNPLGLALYDKTRANVGVDEPKPEPTPKASVKERYAKAIEMVNAAPAEVVLTKLTSTKNYQNLLADLDGKPEKTALMNTVTQRFEKLALPKSPAPANNGAEHAA